MKKSIKLTLISLFLSSMAIAQVTDSIQQYGRGIAVDFKESTTAGATITSEQISHRTSIDPSNSLPGLASGLYVMQNPGTSWDNAATLYIRGLASTP